MNWLKRDPDKQRGKEEVEAALKQIANTTRTFRQFISLSKVFFDNATKGTGLSAAQAAADFEKTRKKLAHDMNGPIGAEKLWNHLLEPELETAGASNLARLSVFSILCLLIDEQRGNPQHQSWIDEDVATLVKTTQKGPVAKALGYGPRNG